MGKGHGLYADMAGLFQRVGIGSFSNFAAPPPVAGVALQHAGRYARLALSSACGRLVFVPFRPQYKNMSTARARYA